MENILLNKELYFTYPDGFHQMDAAECKQNNLNQDGPGISIIDPERHIIVSIGWRKTALGSMMMDADGVAKNMEASMSRMMKGAGYQKSELVQRDLGGQNAYGFDFSYEAQGETIYGSSYVVEKGKTFYYFNFYGSMNRKEENEQLWNGMLNSIKWG